MEELEKLLGGGGGGGGGGLVYPIILIRQALFSGMRIGTDPLLFHKPCNYTIFNFMNILLHGPANMG